MGAMAHLLTGSNRKRKLRPSFALPDPTGYIKESPGTARQRTMDRLYHRAPGTQVTLKEEGVYLRKHSAPMEQEAAHSSRPAAQEALHTHSEPR